MGSSITTHARERRINRYYDPTTNEFLSIDPKVETTNRPYVFTDDDSLNTEDPLGLEEESYLYGDALPSEESSGGGNPLFSYSESVEDNLSRLDPGRTSPNVTVNSVEELQKFFEENTIAGDITYDDGTSENGRIVYTLVDDTQVQYRTVSTEKTPTVDVKFPGKPTVIIKVHIKL